MKVRCVHADGSSLLVEGQEYKVDIIVERAHVLQSAGTPYEFQDGYILQPGYLDKSGEKVFYPYIWDKDRFVVV